MAQLHSNRPEKLSSKQLPNAALTAIGRLIRACAEIEDLVTLYICRLTGISESHVIVLLGRTMISKKIEMAGYLAKMNGAKVASFHKQIFNASMSEVFECRNAVAHGTLLGITLDKRYAFLTATILNPTGPSAVQRAITYSKSDIAGFAEAAHTAVPLIEKHLGLAPLREKRLQQALSPHRKGQSQSKQG